MTQPLRNKFEMAAHEKSINHYKRKPTHQQLWDDGVRE